MSSTASGGTGSSAPSANGSGSGAANPNLPPLLTIKPMKLALPSDNDHGFIKFTQSGTFIVGDFFKINQNGFAFTDSAAATPAAPLFLPADVNAPDAARPAGAAARPAGAAGAVGSGGGSPRDTRISPSAVAVSGAAMSNATPPHNPSPAATPASTTSNGSTASASATAAAGAGTRRLVVASLHDIEPLHAVGQGASGVVRRARHRPTQTIVALKVVPIDLSHTKSQQVVMELKTLYQCHSPYIISFMGAFYKDRAISLVMEYMESGSLTDVLKVSGPLTEELIAEISVQVLRGLLYLHSDRRIIHRDIKPSNILMNSFGHVKLADFGVSGELTAQSASKVSFVGTVTYMSPERIQGQSHSFESDIWSVGLCLLECAIGYFPYLEIAYSDATDQQPPPPAARATSIPLTATATATAAAAASSATSAAPAITLTLGTASAPASAAAALPPLNVRTPTEQATALTSPAVSLLSPSPSPASAAFGSLTISTPAAASAPATGASSSSSTSSSAAGTPSMAVSTPSPLHTPSDSKTPASYSTSASAATAAAAAAAAVASGPPPVLSNLRNRRLSTKVGFWDIMEKIVSQPPPDLPERNANTGVPFSAEFRAFTRACLQKESGKRASAAQLLNHPFLKKYESSNQLPAFMATISQAIDQRKQAFLASGGAAGAGGAGSSASSNPFLAAATSAARAGYAALESPVGTAIRWAAAPEIAPALALPPPSAAAAGGGAHDTTTHLTTTDWGMGGPGRPHFYATTPSGGNSADSSQNATPGGAVTPGPNNGSQPAVEDDIPILAGSETDPDSAAVPAGAGRQTPLPAGTETTETTEPAPPASDAAAGDGAPAAAAGDGVESIPSDALAQLLSSMTDDQPSLPAAPIVWSSPQLMRRVQSTEQPSLPPPPARVASASFLQFAEYSVVLSTAAAAVTAAGGVDSASATPGSSASVTPGSTTSQSSVTSTGAGTGHGASTVVKRKRSATPRPVQELAPHLLHTYPLSMAAAASGGSSGDADADADLPPPPVPAAIKPLVRAANGAGAPTPPNPIARAMSDEPAGGSSFAARPVKRTRRQSQFSFQLNSKSKPTTAAAAAATTAAAGAPIAGTATAVAAARNPYHTNLPPPPPPPAAALAPQIPTSITIPLPSLVRPHSLPTPPSASDM